MKLSDKFTHPLKSMFLTHYRAFCLPSCLHREALYALVATSQLHTSQLQQLGQALVGLTSAHVALRRDGDSKKLRDGRRSWSPNDLRPKASESHRDPTRTCSAQRIGSMESVTVKVKATHGHLEAGASQSCRLGVYPRFNRGEDDSEEQRSKVLGVLAVNPPVHRDLWEGHHETDTTRVFCLLGFVPMLP
ncbi:hypothetical protein BV25DRAFT_1837279 [Artomyces pyxidatus]|uniref:Uncharacterized protein n=1 Tax=Artomyces pyxidatus TaxID=48021 RepID=A0ACB8T5K8_9AGAM|nr:hypothetical protein BV25DRAFT_1837279 [Artomyces pyxidatus]